MGTSSASRAWLWWPVAGAFACVLYVLIEVPWHASLLSAGVGLVAATLTVVGRRRQRSANASAWRLFAVGLVLWACGDGTFAVYQVLGGYPPYPSVGDAFYLSAYPVFVVALFWLTRERRPRDLDGVIDLSVIATGLGLVYWVYVIGPIVRDETTPPLVRLVTAAYPTTAVLLCAVIAPLLTQAGRRTPSLWLVTFGSVMTLAGNVSYTLFGAIGGFWGKAIFGSFLFGYTCFAGAALQPSAHLPAGPRAAARYGGRRLATLTASTLLVPGMLVVEAVRGGEAADLLAIAFGAIILFALMLARLSGFFSTVQRQSRQLADLAMRDELTGLANRRLFEQQLTDALAAGPVQVAVLDLNGFKEVNDTYGHAAGDRLLEVTADRLREAVRGGDLVARMGGDEFAILVRDVSVAEMDAIAERVAAGLRRPVDTGVQELVVSASVGTADGADAATADEVLRRADAAMYAAKRAGGGRHLRHTADLDAQATVRAAAAAELRTALETGQFHLVYQPIVTLPEGRIVSVEALVRWTRPHTGFVSPAEFVPIAEETGLIVELGEWILRTACAQAVTWQHDFGAAAPQRISVNVSARQLAEPGFADLCGAVLDETGLRPAQLVVEVTETSVFAGGQALRTVQTLHERGVQIALDDFGTGHSSLTLLQELPVDVLKVDRSFVETITKAGRHAVIATALIQVAQGLGLSAVAEGVETAAQAAELHRLGYRLAQGYHFGRPVAEPDFTRSAASAPV